jgi:hypothetical protein
VRVADVHDLLAQRPPGAVLDALDPLLRRGVPGNVLPGPGAGQQVGVGVRVARHMREHVPHGPPGHRRRLAHGQGIKTFGGTQQALGRRLDIGHQHQRIDRHGETLVGIRFRHL